MKRMCITLAALGLAALALGGCASHAVQASLNDPSYSPPAASPAFGEPALAHLGAGDQLGNAIFVRYLASLRQDDGSRFATGSSDAPDEN